MVFRKKGRDGMAASEVKEKLSKLEKFKYPFIILVIGLVLMLLPGGSPESDSSYDKDSLLQQVLCCSDGVGRAQLISSENGVVIVCEGAENARVRLDIIRAVSSYTGFSSDKITILKMTI